MPSYAIGFNHNGQWTAFPSSFTTINAEALEARNQGPTGIMAILATGAGFFPPQQASSLPFDIGSPSRFLPPSDLRTAAEFAVRRFTEPDIDGPGQIFVVPVTAATKSTLDIEDIVPATLATLTSKGWGLKMNAILVKSEAGLLTVTLPTDSGANIVETFAYTTVAELVEEINGRSGIVEAAFVLEGTPDTFVDTPMAGGTEPAATNDDWAAAFAAIDPLKINVVHVASGDSVNVWPMLIAHLASHRGRGFVGSTNIRNWNGVAARAAAITALIAEAAALNSPRVMHIGLGADGQPGYLAAARYAALAASLPPSVPMTFKRLDFVSLEARLTREEVGGVTGLLVNGVAPPVPDPRNESVFLVSRGLSTWTGDANLYRREHSVLAAVDGVQDEIEQAMFQFLGLEGTFAVLGRATQAVAEILRLASRPDSAIRILAFDREQIVVTFSSDTVMRVAASLTPIIPINFIVTTLALERTDITIEVDVNLAASPQV
jgi:hypothetical protein